jgi:uncharacterized protein (UPF0297 family)
VSLNMFLDNASAVNISDDSRREVHVAMHEQLSSLYNDSEAPENQVIGYIHVS